MGGAWDRWKTEVDAYRARVASLLGAPRLDTIVPKTSAGQGLRAVLNSHDNVPRVVATRGEFDSLDVILREYARRGRIRLNLVEPREDGWFNTRDIIAAIVEPIDLVVVSEVFFNSGQRLGDIAKIVSATHAAGGKLLLDVYHSLGVFPVDVEEAFQLWRFRHMKTVERIIGHKTGTGGSSGVAFLKRALEHSFFPELIDVRTEIGA